MNTLVFVAFACAALALVRYAVGVVMLIRYLRRARVTAIPAGPTPPITILKPLYGADPGLEENLLCTLRQNYPEFEVIFCHERTDDLAVDIARAAAQQVPDVPVRFVEGRDVDAANPKVAVLLRGAPKARHALLASADSDVRPDPLYLRDIANGLAEGEVVSFLPVLFGMKTTWMRLAALSVNTDGFLALLMAHGRIVTGATIGMDGAALERAGGYRAIADYAADDFALGQALQGAGSKAVLARRAARIYAPGGSATDSMRWLLRWARTVRTSAPRMYVLSLLPACAPPLLLAVALCSPHTTAALALLLAHTFLRVFVAVAVDLRFCWDRSLIRGLWLLPLHWILEPVGLILGLFGHTIVWRGRRYRIKGGRASLLTE